MANDKTRARFVKAPTGGELHIFESVTACTDYTNPALYQFEGCSFTFGEDNKGENLETWEQVEARTKKEWAEGIYIFQQFVERLTSAALPDTKDKRRRMRYGTEGDEIDFERMRQGHTDFWKSYSREESFGPTTMTVVIDTTTPAFQNSNDILWRGAAAIALAKILEEKGWGVEIWVVNGSNLYENEEIPVYTACCLKKPSDPLDVSTLTSTVSGWFYRTATFAMLRTIAQNQGRMAKSSYGRCATPTEQELDLLSSDELRVYSAGVFSFEGAIGIIETQLEKIRDMFAAEEEK